MNRLKKPVTIRLSIALVVFCVLTLIVIAFERANNCSFDFVNYRVIDWIMQITGLVGLACVSILIESWITEP